MNENNPFDKQVDVISHVLDKMLETHRNKGITDSREWLETLFNHYSDRMLSDNERIWRTGALFVPISLAAFAVLAGIQSLQLWHILALGASSIILMWTWIVIAENHRSFQQKSEAWLIAIQRAMDLDAPRQVKVVKAGGLERYVTRKSAVQKMRWFLLIMVVVFWFFILVGYFLGIVS